MTTFGICDNCTIKDSVIIKRNFWEVIIVSQILLCKSYVNNGVLKCRILDFYCTNCSTAAASHIFQVYKVRSKVKLDMQTRSLKYAFIINSHLGH